MSSVGVWWWGDVVTTPPCDQGLEMMRRMKATRSGAHRPERPQNELDRHIHHELNMWHLVNGSGKQQPFVTVWYWTDGKSRFLLCYNTSFSTCDSYLGLHVTTSTQAAKIRSPHFRFSLWIKYLWTSAMVVTCYRDIYHQISIMVAAAVASEAAPEIQWWW